MWHTLKFRTLMVQIFRNWSTPWIMWRFETLLKPTFVFISSIVTRRFIFISASTAVILSSVTTRCFQSIVHLRNILQHYAVSLWRMSPVEGPSLHCYYGNTCSSALFCHWLDIPLVTTIFPLTGQVALHCKIF